VWGRHPSASGPAPAAGRCPPQRGPRALPPARRRLRTGLQRRSRLSRPVVAVIHGLQLRACRSKGRSGRRARSPGRRRRTSSAARRRAAAQRLRPRRARPWRRRKRGRRGRRRRSRRCTVYRSSRSWSARRRTARLPATLPSKTRRMATRPATTRSPPGRALSGRRRNSRRSPRPQESPCRRTDSPARYLLTPAYRASFSSCASSSPYRKSSRNFPVVCTLDFTRWLLVSAAVW